MNKVNKYVFCDVVSEGLDSRLFPLVFAMACFSLDEAEEMSSVQPRDRNILLSVSCSI
jgi:hypothetical protein